MTREHQPGAGNYLWHRVHERYRSKRGAWHRRVALVFRRIASPAQPEAPRAPARPNVSHYQFALHLHLSLAWPPGSARMFSLDPPRPLNVLHGFVRHVQQTAALPMRGSGVAPRDHAAPRSRPDTLPRERAHRPASSTSSPAATPTIAPSSTPAPGSPTRAAALRLDTRGAVPSIPAAPLRHLRAAPATRAAAPEPPPARALRPMRSRALFSESVTQRHVRNVVRVVDSSDRLARGRPEERPRPAASPAEMRPGPSAKPLRRVPRGAHVTLGDSPVRFRRVEGSHRPFRSDPPALDSSPPAARRWSPRQVHESIARQGVDRSAVVTAARSPLYAHPVSRDFSNQPVATAAQHAPPPEPRPAPPMPRTQAVQPQIDVARLSEDVYQHIQRRMRIERERRGL